MIVKTTNEAVRYLDEVAYSMMLEGCIKVFPHLIKIGSDGGVVISEELLNAAIGVGAQMSSARRTLQSD